MNEDVREMTTEEKLYEEISKLKIELNEARAAVEHNRQIANEEPLKRELYYRDGMIAAFKYALRCNGISGGEVDKER